MTLAAQLEEAEAQVERLKLQIKQGTCAETGHDWKHYGGRNAGCGDDCTCSVPVNVCTKCDDCDYGENDEADTVRADCAAGYGD